MPGQPDAASTSASLGFVVERILAFRFDDLDLKLREEAQLVRVSERFRVIAIGLPVPPFPGFPLDPPLRSRFVARQVLRILEEEGLLCSSEAAGDNAEPPPSPPNFVKFCKICVKFRHFF